MQSLCCGSDRLLKILFVYWIVISIGYMQVQCALLTGCPLVLYETLETKQPFSTGLPMKISARSRYATRILIDLAQNEKDSPLRTTSIAERTGISVQFIEQILKPLKQSELVVSKRGAMGGYSLNKRPEEISLGEIIRIMEGPLCLTDCCDDSRLCVRSGFCMTRDAWRRVSAIMANALDSMKLSDVINGVAPFCPNADDDDSDICDIC